MQKTHPLKVSYADIIFTKHTDKNIRIIAASKYKKEIGLYDPGMYYYTHASKTTLPGFYRYFSPTDYKTGNHVSIGVNQCQLNDPNTLQLLEYQFQTTMINCFQDSPLSDNEPDIVSNWHMGLFYYFV